LEDYPAAVQEALHAGLRQFAVVDELGFYGFEGCDGD